MLVLNAEWAGGKILYTTSEIVPADSARSELILRGAPGTQGMIAFDCPCQLEMNDVVLHTSCHDNHHVIEYEHSAKPLYLKLTKTN